MPKYKLKESPRKSKWQETINGIITCMLKLILMIIVSLRNLVKPYIQIESMEKNDNVQFVSQKLRWNVPPCHKDPIKPEQKDKKEDPQNKIPRHKHLYWTKSFLKKPNYNTELTGRLKVFPYYSSCLFPRKGVIRLRTVPCKRAPTQKRVQQVCHMSSLNRASNMDGYHFQPNTIFQTTFIQTQVWPTETVWDYERRRKEGQQLLRRLAKSDALIAQLWQDNTVVEKGRRRKECPQREENIPETHDQVGEVNHPNVSHFLQRRKTKNASGRGNKKVPPSSGDRTRERNRS